MGQVSSFPPPAYEPLVGESSRHSSSLEGVVDFILESHPEQVAFYAAGKSCVGFLVTRVMSLSGATVEDAHKAVVAALEARTKSS